VLKEFTTPICLKPPMPVRAVLNTIVALSFAFAAVPAIAQSATASVQLSVVVPSRASVTKVYAPEARSVSDGLTEFAMQITVDANAPYRVTALRAASADSATFVRATDGQRLSLRGGAGVVVARGGRGLQTIELSYWAPAERAVEPPTYTITLETAHRAP
jgi:hypothetical protein